MNSQQSNDEIRKRVMQTILDSGFLVNSQALKQISLEIKREYEDSYASSFQRRLVENGTNFNSAREGVERICKDFQRVTMFLNGREGAIERIDAIKELLEELAEISEGVQPAKV
jgi:hypothetical protein